MPSYDQKPARCRTQSQSRGFRRVGKALTSSGARGHRHRLAGPRGASQNKIPTARGHLSAATESAINARRCAVIRALRRGRRTRCPNRLLNRKASPGCDTSRRSREKSLKS
jgi:hypothetical protein